MCAHFSSLQSLLLVFVKCTQLKFSQMPWRNYGEVASHTSFFTKVQKSEKSPWGPRESIWYAECKNGLKNPVQLHLIKIWLTPFHYITSAEWENYKTSRDSVLGAILMFQAYNIQFKSNLIIHITQEVWLLYFEQKFKLSVLLNKNRQNNCGQPSW